MNTSKLFPNSAVVPSTSSQNIGASEEKFGQLKVTVNGNTSMQNVPTGAVENNFSHQISGSKREDAKGMQQSDIISGRGETNDKVSSGRCPNNMMKASSSACVPSVSSIPDEIYDNLRMQNGEANTLQQSLENDVMVRDSQESHGDENLNHKPNLLKEESVQVLDEKIYYTSCSINGHVYKVMDHVLIRFDNDKLIPSKLQAMWEDNLSSKKWVTVKHCYFPGDLPEAVGRPCLLENSEPPVSLFTPEKEINYHVKYVVGFVLCLKGPIAAEKFYWVYKVQNQLKEYIPSHLELVYESTCDRTVMAGLIQSPCEVLPAKKFAEETEKRSCSGAQQGDLLPPLYLCKCVYCFKHSFLLPSSQFVL
ncbi:UNVERIFIED_CONTAM: hypothetical protein Sangu_2392500 [Sesamum angustifolium]|uniref:BAH domain-containing protein n=1 Tax=Sesamum angustifolium TaxID=2727405 RepID=A0AAW2KWW4_9LAMI